VDRMALDTVRKLGMTPVEVHISDWPYDSLQIFCFQKPPRRLSRKLSLG
jgi:hypothetical protein